MLFNKFFTVGAPSLLFILFVAFQLNGVVSEPACDAVTSKLQGSMGNVSVCYHPQQKIKKSCPSFDSLFTNPEDIVSFSRCEVAICSSISGSKYNCKEWKTAKNSECCADISNGRVCLNPTPPTGNVKTTIWKIYRVVTKDNCGSEVYSEVVVPNTRFAVGFSTPACDKNFPTTPSPNAQCSGTVANGITCQRNFQCTSGYCEPGSCKRSANETYQARLVCPGTCATPPPAQGCSNDAGCSSGERCDLGSGKRSGGSCVALLPNGDPCNDGYECASDFCNVQMNSCNSKRGVNMTEAEKRICARSKEGVCATSCEVDADCVSGQKCHIEQSCKRGMEDVLTEEQRERCLRTSGQGFCYIPAGDDNECDNDWECQSENCETQTCFAGNVNKTGKCYTPISNNQACGGEEWRCYSRYCPGGSTCQASCLLGSTKIFMADGVTQKSVVELEVGDKILGSNGAPATLLFVSDESAKVTYSINESPTFFTREHAFSVPAHPELIQAVDIHFSPRTPVSTSLYNNTKMQVGSDIYKWNPSRMAFDTVVINDIQSMVREVDVPVHIFVVHEAARRGGHVAEGYLAQSRRDHSNTLTYSIRSYIAATAASEFSASLQDYITRGGDLRGKNYFKALSVKTFDVLSANLNNYTKSIARDVTHYDAWDVAMQDYVDNANPLHDAYAEILSFKMAKYITPIAWKSVSVGKDYVDNSFIPFLTAVLRSVKLDV